MASRTGRSTAARLRDARRLTRSRAAEPTVVDSLRDKVVAQFSEKLEQRLPELIDAIVEDLLARIATPAPINNVVDLPDQGGLGDFEKED